MSSGQDTDIKSLVTRVDMLEEVNRALEDEQRQIRRDAMHLENVVATIWRATMGPIPDPTPDPMPTPPAPPKQPTGAKNRVSEAINSLRGRLGW